MSFEDLVAAIDGEIARLRHARSLLSFEEPSTAKRAVQKTAGEKTSHTAGKRTVSAEGRARMAAAQKKRWAAQKKAAK